MRPLEPDVLRTGDATLPPDDVRLFNEGRLLPLASRYRVIFNGDSRHCAGSDVRNAGAIMTVDTACMGRPARLWNTLPPLGSLILRRDP